MNLNQTNSGDQPWRKVFWRWIWKEIMLHLLQSALERHQKNKKYCPQDNNCYRPSSFQVVKISEDAFLSSSSSELSDTGSLPKRISQIWSMISDHVISDFMTSGRNVIISDIWQPEEKSAKCSAKDVNVLQAAETLQVVLQVSRLPSAIGPVSS